MSRDKWNVEEHGTGPFSESWDEPPTGLTKRLKELSKFKHSVPIDFSIGDEAADEIARLTAEYTKVIKERDEVQEQLLTMKSLLQEIYEWTTAKHTPWAVKTKQALKGEIT